MFGETEPLLKTIFMVRRKTPNTETFRSSLIRADELTPPKVRGMGRLEVRYATNKVVPSLASLLPRPSAQGTTTAASTRLTR